MFTLLLGRKWAAQNERKCSIVYKYKNPERKKCRVWLKCYFSMTSMYMEYWDLLPKMTTGVSPNYWLLQGCAQTTKNQHGPPVREPLCFPKWEDLKWGSWEKQGFGWCLWVCSRSHVVPALWWWRVYMFQVHSTFKVLEKNNWKKTNPNPKRKKGNCCDSSLWRGKAGDYQSNCAKSQWYCMRCVQNSLIKSKK